MPEKIRYQKNIPQDLDRILTRYQSELTANRVRSSISRTFELIESFPKMYAVVYDDIRLVKTKDYPVMIQFRLLEDVPVILPIFFAGEKNE
jgi:hypothetical protein